MIETKRDSRAIRAIGRVLRIHVGEGALVGWIGSFFMVVQSSHGLGANAADALFFSRFGVERLPVMILVSGPAVMVFILGHGAGLGSRGASRWLWLATLGCSVWASLLWVGASFDTQWVYPVIWVSTQVIIMVTFTIMWNSAGAACTTRQAKRLFPIFATAGVAGGVLGNVATGPLAAVLGAENLLLVQSGLLLGAMLILIQARSLFRGDDETPAASLVAELGRTLATVRSSRFLGLAAVVAVAMSCLFHLVYFPFSESVAASFATEAETAAFLGTFSSIATVATFLVSLFLTNRLFGRFGLVLTLMILPIVYGAGFATWLFVFTLVSAAIVRGLQLTTVNGIGFTAFTALFNVVTGRRRAQVVAFMSAVPLQIGTAVAGMVLILTNAAPDETVFVIGLVIALLTLAVVLVLRGSYLDALVSAVRKGVTGLFDTPAQGVFTPTDADALKVLREHLSDPRPAARVVAVSAFAHLGDAADASWIEPMLADEDSMVRSVAFDAACAIDSDRISTHADTAIRDESPEVRLHVVRYLGSLLEEDHRSVVRTALADSDPRVSAAAARVVGGEEGQSVIDELLSSPNSVAVAAALTETAGRPFEIAVDPAPFLDHASPAVRSAAATSHGRHGGDPSLLVPGLDDRSQRVREASARALAASGRGRALMLKVLEDGSVTASEAVLAELTPGVDASDGLGTWARRESQRAAQLQAWARGLDVEPRSGTHAYLLKILRMRSRRLIKWVLIAMTTQQTRDQMPIVSRGIGSADVEVQAQAIEALENVGAREVLSILLPLLESDPSRSRPDVKVSLTGLAGDFDPWLSALAQRVLAEGDDGDTPPMASLSAMKPEHPTLGSMDRVLVLQRVHMFSELDPEDLALIAVTTAEVVYEPAEPVYVIGDTGSEMLVIVDGSAVVTLGSGRDQRVIHTYGPGEHVGELALLTGEPRSADVHAGEEGLRGLALSMTDLMSVLEERPTVAIGMLGTLASRLIEQTQASEAGQPAH